MDDYCSYRTLRSDDPVGDDPNFWLEPFGVYWRFHAQFGEFGAAGDFSDGDVVVVQATDLDTGMLVIDVVQSVTYADSGSISCGECVHATVRF